MPVNGVDLDRKIRAAKAHLKGQRRGARERAAVRAYAELVALRDLYRATVHARFDLDEPRQTSLAAAIAYAKHARGHSRAKLWAQIHEAKRVRVELPRGARVMVTAGASIDATHVTLVVRLGTGKAFQRIERDMLWMTKHPNVLVWDTFRLAFRRAGLGEPLPVWHDFTSSVSAVARTADVVEARLVRQREEVA